MASYARLSLLTSSINSLFWTFSIYTSYAFTIRLVNCAAMERT